MRSQVQSRRGGRLLPAAACFALAMTLLPVAAARASTAADWSCTIERLVVERRDGGLLPAPAPTISTNVRGVRHWDKLKGSGTAVCTDSSRPALGPISVSVAVDTINSWYEMAECRQPPDVPGATLGSKLYLDLIFTRPNGTQASSDYWLHFSGADPIEPAAHIDGAGTDALGHAKVRFLYPRLGQTRCLGDDIAKIDISGQFAIPTSPGSTGNHAAASVLETEALAHDIVTATAASAVDSTLSEIPEIATAVHPDCWGSMVAARGFDVYGDTARSASGDVLLVSGRRLLEFKRRGRGAPPLLQPLKLGNGILASGGRDGESWQVVLRRGERLRPLGRHAVAVVDKRRSVLGVIVVAGAADVAQPLEIDIDEGNGNVTIHENYDDAVPETDPTVRSIVFLATADPHYLAVCEVQPEAQAPGGTETSSSVPGAGPDYYNRAWHGDAYAASRRRLAYCFTDTNDNLPFYQGGRVVANVWWFCRNGTRETIDSYLARAELQRLVKTAGERIYWGLMDRAAESGVKAEPILLPLNAPCRTSSSLYRTRTRMWFGTDLRGRLPDSPLYTTHSRDMDC